jgi:outer membrane lipoprotein SlyB
MRRSRLALALLAALVLPGCQRSGQNTYSASEVGYARAVDFGTVVAVREVAIKGEQTGIGAAVGGAAGGVAGAAFGHGIGNVASTLGGVLLGGLAGAGAEQAIGDRTGLEYTVTMQNGSTIQVVQNRNEGDRVLQPGERVMVQANGATQRVLPADRLPTELQRPKGITVKD